MARHNIPSVITSEDDDDPRYTTPGGGSNRSSSLDDYTRAPIYDPRTRTPYDEIAKKSPAFGIVALAMTGAANLIVILVFFPLQQILPDTGMLGFVSWSLFFVEGLLAMIAIVAGFGAKYGTAAFILAIILNPYIVITFTFMVTTA